MEPITATIIIILGRYIIDKGVDLGKEVGPKALDAAREIVLNVIEKMRKKKPNLAEYYMDDPKAYEVPVEKFLESEFKNDQDFELTIKQLLDLYSNLRSEHQQMTNSTHTISHVHGSTVVTGNDNIVVGGAMTGNINATKDRSDKPAEGN